MTERGGETQIEERQRWRIDRDGGETQIEERQRWIIDMDGGEAAMGERQGWRGGIYRASEKPRRAQQLTGILRQILQDVYCLALFSSYRIK